VRLAEFSEKEQELKSKVKGALMYPLFLGAFGIITVGVLLVFVVPRLTSIFSDFGQALPLPTKILMSVSHFLGAWWWLIVVIIGLFLFTIYQQGRTKEGKFYLDKIRLRLPILGKLSLMGELARFSRTLAALFESGVPVLKSLEIVADTMTNEVVRRELLKIHDKIAKGASLGLSMEESLHFPLFMTNMIKIGEKGGLLEKSLLKIADAYDREVDRFTHMFTTLLEPIMIVTMGLIIGFIVVSMLLPIFNINLAVK
jgi:type II secretory pathway component PulF